MGRQAGSAYIDFTARTTGVTTGLEKARAEARKAARQMKADFREAQASIALLGEEVGVKLPRHLRSFVAELPGVAQAMSAAFSGAAVIGLGMIAVEQAKKIYEAFQHLHELPEQIGKDFDKLTQSIAAGNDELKLQNINLQNAINKFRGAPENKLAEQLAEATAEAVKLGNALAKDLDAYDAIFEKNKVGWWAQLMGTGGIDDVKDQITKFRDDFEKETNASNERIRKARDAGNKQLLDKTVADEKAAATARMQNEISAVQTELAERQKWQKEYEQHPGRMAHPLQDAPIKALQGVLEALNQTLDHTVLGFDNLAASETKAGLTGLSAAERQKEWARELADEFKRADEAAQREAASSQRVTDAITASWLEMNRAEEDAQKKKEEGETKLAEATKRAQEQIRQQADETQKGIREAASQTYADFAQSEQMKVNLGEESNSQRIDHLKAALAAEQEAIQRSLDDQRAMYETGSKDWVALQNEKVKAAAEANRQIADLTQQQLQAGIGGALAEIRKKGMDTAGAIKDIFTQTLNNLNDQLVNLMTGKKTNFKGVAAGLFSSIAKTGLQSAEGKLLGGLGGVKPDGSKDRPFHVINAGADGKAGGILGSVISTFIPHATGGPVAPGRAYLVGERGPEPFFPGVSGTMGTNAAMRGTFGGTTTHAPTYVDARGSSDPAAVSAAVHRAMRSYAPTLIGASAAFQNDQRRRGPALSAKSV